MHSPYLNLSMRYLKFNEHPLTHSRMGEAVYTLNTSNFRWPRGVSYQEMMACRSEVIKLAVRGGNA